MKKTTIPALVLLLGFIFASPAYAQTDKNKYALGDMYTKALNMVEACGMLDTLEPVRHRHISNIHMDHGLVLITIEDEGQSKNIGYDPLANKIIYND